MKKISCMFLFVFTIWSVTFAQQPPEKEPINIEKLKELEVLQPTQLPLTEILIYKPTAEDHPLMDKIVGILNEMTCVGLIPIEELIEEKRVKRDYTKRKHFFIWYILDKIQKKCPEIKPFPVFNPSLLPTTWKPVIYLYPEEETAVSVDLEVAGELAFTYPEYNDWWNVIASPDWTLVDSFDGKEYSYLFWEWVDTHDYYDMNSWFIVPRDEVVSFLQSSLIDLWLLPHEYNEFIVYRAPKMLEHAEPYFFVRFASEQEYGMRNPLSIRPEPDVVERIYMVFEPRTEVTEVEPQPLTWFARDWFTVVERWGTDLSELQ